MILHVKNMVCPRCIKAVKSELQILEIEYDEVSLGEIKLKNSIDDHTRELLQSKLTEEGFELIDDRKTQIIKKIKAIVIDWIHHKKQLPQKNWSDLLADEMHLEYKYLSQLFSSVEGITIEHYIQTIKSERVKELISYDHKSLSEIAYLAGYSNVAHLSSQFKKITGMTPSQFKKLGQKPRVSLDKL